MVIHTKDRKQLIGTLTYADGAPQYSPDGRKIAFQSNRTGSWEVWTCDADGSSCQQVTTCGGPVCSTPRWSPDGQRLAFESRTEGQSEIYVIAADGGRSRRMTDHAADDVMPSWSRDGRWIYFASDRSGKYEAWKGPSEDGQAVQVTRFGGYAASESQDGRYVYYTKSARVSSAYMSGAGRLFRMPAAGGEEIEILPEVWEANFHVTAKGIYFASDTKAIKFLDLATGKVSTLAMLDRAIFGLSVSPDDAFLAWGQANKVGADLMLVEGFR